MSLARVLGWLARLPLCGESELAGLLGGHHLDMRRLAHELALRGWVESVEPGSPELERRRRYFVRWQAAPTFAGVTGCSKPPQHYPMRRQDILKRLARFETVIGVNRLLADLATHARRSGRCELSDARSLPVALPPRERWWLPATEAYGCLRDGRLWSPFMVAWDRVAAPNRHRQTRLDTWTKARNSVARHWGADGLPPVLVVCPSPAATMAWERNWRARAEGGGPQPPGLLLAIRDDFLTQGIDGPVWRRPGDREPEPLLEQLGWGSEPPFASPHPTASAIDTANPPRAERRLLHRWAEACAIDPGERSTWERAAALAVATGPQEHLLIDWTARHPTLRPADLAVLTDESPALIERRIEWLKRCRVIGGSGLTTDG